MQIPGWQLRWLRLRRTSRMVHGSLHSCPQVGGPLGRVGSSRSNEGQTGQLISIRDGLWHRVFAQVCGIHYNEVFASTARMAAMRTVIAIAAAEDLELDSVDVSTAFLNGDIDAEVYMKIPEGLSVEGDPAPWECPNLWGVRLFKGS